MILVWGSCRCFADTSPDGADSVTRFSLKCDAKQDVLHTPGPASVFPVSGDELTGDIIPRSGRDFRAACARRRRRSSTKPPTIAPMKARKTTPPAIPATIALTGGFLLPASRSEGSVRTCIAKGTIDGEEDACVVDACVVAATEHATTGIIDVERGASQSRPSDVETRG